MKKLPKELLVATRLSEFKEHLSNTLCHMVWFQQVLWGAGLDDPYEFFPVWDILWFCHLKISCYWVEYPSQHAKQVSRARTNEELKLVSELKQTQYHATFLLPLHTLTTSHHSRDIRSLLHQMHLGCSLCIGLLVAQGFLLSLPAVPNLLGILDLCILQIPSCQSIPPSLVLLGRHPCPFLHCQAGLSSIKYVHLLGILSKTGAGTRWGVTSTLWVKVSAPQAEFSYLL